MDDHHVAAPRHVERMVPEQCHARTFWEHLARYRFAKSFVKGKRVLDIACGEGYGSAALEKAGAASVTGVDISPEACEHAKRKYGIDVRVGDALAIPLSDRSIDVVVSFETLEHVEAPAAFVRECARVLVANGTLIISTPNRPIYSGDYGQNPFHLVEFDEDEFVEMLRANFQTVRLYTQFPHTVAWWSLRSLAAERSPWLRIKGFWRLSAWFCPAIRNTVSPAIRARAVDLVLTPDRFPATIFNPYVVRAHSPRIDERPYILVAVATGLKAVR